MYNLGFVVYTASSFVLTVDPFTGRVGADWLIVGRIVQGVGAAFLIANSAAILTDAFPPDQRGLALGVNNIAGISGSFIGLVLGGVLGPIDWWLVFLVSVPFGLFGTIWSYLKLKELGEPHRSSIDWAGNLTFAAGLVLLMVGITAGIQPADGHPTGWTSLRVLALLASGVASLIAFLVIESRQPDAMFRLRLFKIKAFTFGTPSTLLSAVARGGLMFMLIIWLQGIWLPLHGWLGGHFHASPNLRLPARRPALGLSLRSAGLALLRNWRDDRFRHQLRPSDGASDRLRLSELRRDPFSQRALHGSVRRAQSGGHHEQPSRAGPWRRGRDEFHLPEFRPGSFDRHLLHLDDRRPVGPLSTTLTHGLMQHGVPASVAAHVGALPPVSVLFAAFLGYNPIATLLGPAVLDRLPSADRMELTGHSYFPNLISAPFHAGLTEAFIFAALVCLIAAAASWSRAPPDRQGEVGGGVALGITGISVAPTFDRRIRVGGRASRARGRRDAAPPTHPRCPWRGLGNYA